MSQKRLSGRIALVTGAARLRGIGRATALRLADEGAAVIVSGAPRDPATFPEEEKKLDWRGALSVVDEIRHKGGKAIAIDCDVTDPTHVAALFAEAERELGTPDAIVNNAGTGGTAGVAPIIDLSDEEWSQTIAINLTGVFNVCKAAARGMRAAQKPGAIVNVASLAGRFGILNYGAYCASKFGVIGFTQQLSLELARMRVRVNCVCPGSVQTSMMESTFVRVADRSKKVDAEGVRQALVKTIPMGRQGLPEEQAAMISFLLSEEASYVTGQAINVDGGFRMD